MEKIILVGAGGHAKSVVDSIETSGQFEIVGFVDKGKIGEEIYHSYKIIGRDKDLPDFYRNGIRYAFICIGFMGNSSIREVLYRELLRTGYQVPVIIDKQAVLASDVVIGEGTYVGKQVVLNAGAIIGKMCIMNTSAIAEHETAIGDFSHLAVGGILCGRAEIGKSVFIGANATVTQNVKVGDKCIIGAGSVVLKDVPHGCTVVGIPAKIIKEVE